VSNIEDWRFLREYPPKKTRLDSILGFLCASVFAVGTGVLIGIALCGITIV